MQDNEFLILTPEFRSLGRSSRAHTRNRFVQLLDGGTPVTSQSVHILTTCRQPAHGAAPLRSTQP